LRERVDAEVVAPTTDAPAVAISPEEEAI
jgi:hypothetical protein